METATLKKINTNANIFKEILRSRQSCRGFLDKPLQDDLITSVLEDAQLAPSNCNTQPWPCRYSPNIAGLFCRHDQGNIECTE
jgi:hypothetical protein